MKRVALYIRVSTEEQKIHGLSLETQKDALIEYANKHHFSIVDYYIDAGLTARKKLSHRKEMLRLLDDVKKGKIDLIIFTKLDRWFRNISDYYKVQEIIERHNVNWKTIYEDYDTSTANGRLHINIMLSIAQDEADRTSERIKVVFESKRARGETPANRAPLGYKIVNSKLLVDETTKQIAIDIFNNYDLTHSVNGCVRLARERYGYKIYDYSIRRMFENPTYTGCFKNIPNFNEAIISPELFNRIKTFRAAREFKNQLAEGRTYLFSTLIFCKECGHNMSCRFTRQMHKDGLFEYHYYRCKEAGVHKVCPNKKERNELYIEEYLLNHFENALKAKVLEIESKPKKKITHISADKLTKRLTKLKDLYLDDLISKSDYKEEYDIISKQLYELSLSEDSVDTSKYKKLLDMDIKSIYNNFSPTERKKFWLGALEKVLIDQNGKYEIFLR